MALCCGAALLAGCGSDDGGAEQGSRPHPPLKGSPAVGKAAERPDPGDFNGDGYDDYAAVLDADGLHDDRGRATLTVVYGSKKGLLTGSADRLRGRSDDELFAALHRADLDGDGFTDLIGSRMESDDWQTFVMHGGPRGLSGPRPLQLSPATRVLAVGDFDGDGAADLIDGGRGGSGDITAMEPKQDPAAVLLGPFTRDGSPSRSIPLDLGQHGFISPRTAVTGDVDGDRRTDALLFYDFDVEQDDTAPEDLTSIAYLRGDRTKGLVPGPAVRPDLYESMATADGVRGGTIADVDGDGISDVVASGVDDDGYAGGAESPGQVTVIHGSRNGLGRGRPATRLQLPSRASSLWGSGPQVGDVTGDERPDLLVGDADPRGRIGGQLTLLPGGDEGPRIADRQTVDPTAEGLPSRTGRPDRWSGFDANAMLDLNGDGRQDVVVYADKWEPREHERGSGRRSKERMSAFLAFRGTADGLDPAQVQYFTSEDVSGGPTLE
ncbi:VCBS repeat-containing protein [Streptomyces sp. NPDC041068]|uniref:FG-GAP repeat domain-containing protein n=1 Tax=Streptomyces sp. NPDC041068 TaxID=3155130 RepID=UPI0033FDF0B1